MGAVYQIRQAVPEARVVIASEMPKWICWINNVDMRQAIDVAELIETDFLVVAGMTLCDEFIEVQGPVLLSMARRGVKIVFLGASLLLCHGEIVRFQRFLLELRPHGFISRDRVSFSHFKDLSRSHDGIDCAFFVREAFTPAALTLKNFVIYNFDAMDEPEIDNHGRKVVRTQHALSKCSPIHSGAGKRRTLQAPVAVCRKERSGGPEFYSRPDMMISDIPDDYLHLFANAYATYSDRVHACIPTLSFGNWARLSPPRRVRRCSNASASGVRNELVKVDQHTLSADKTTQISFLRELFERP